VEDYLANNRRALLAWSCALDRLFLDNLLEDVAFPATAVFRGAAAIKQRIAAAFTSMIVSAPTLILPLAIDATNRKPKYPVDQI